MSIQPIPTSFLPYHEPGIETILILSSLLLVLNVINTAFDQLIFCGLLGQVFVGVAWGTPGAKWLSVETEHVIVQLGYLGLILLVYEGGLTTSFRSLKANLALSAAVAITGICFPIALSFVLVSLSNATPIQAFAAGAALCSTSLGTTFTILSTSGLSTTRLGVVLSSAAMMDDVVGLIMVQVISNLGASSDTFSAETVVRPLAVSVGLAVVIPLLCRFVALPLTKYLNEIRKSNLGGVVDQACRHKYSAFIIQTAILLGLVTGATYAGTSNLFAAYLAGAASSWWDSEVPHINGAVKTSTSTQDIAVIREPRTSAVNGPVVRSTGSLQDTRQVAPEHYNPVVSTGAGVFETHYETALRCILKPFFFASIGFAIPITDMFRGDIVWRGIVYTILMLLAKLVTGIWLVRLDISWPKVHLPKALRSILNFPASCIGLRHSKQKFKGDSSFAPTIAGQDSNHEPLSKSTDDAPASAPAPATATASLPLSPPMNPRPSDASPPLATSTQASKISRPLSLYPAAILGTAMTARGEIGFLIASLAETTGIFSPSGESISESSEIYLVVTWAIVLCTIIGPLSVGTLVKRVRRLDRDRTEGSGNGKGDPLGIWGVG
ncbi:related to Na+/H+ antiporter [Rhynchosporium agropyri]|uniref:Related to Na+/H+ antiporter n=1 Tax=Rhynchosporium agropyri TaxID=914238 RepID=A0A1E1LCN6_9HELO|nr:related to Na+/H+ antiporter [Rhynchosporium agropyri]